MNTPSEELSPYFEDKRRQGRKSMILFALALIPFLLIFLLNWLNSFGFYLHPFFMIGLCPLGAITILALFVAGINGVRKNYQGKSNEGNWWLYITLAVVGIIAALAFIWATYAYTIDTYMHG
jgi:uncharacterized membrane protein HdeD (DUF308 family)